MALLRSKTVTISITCPQGKVYDFVSNPSNLPKWAKTYCRSIERLNDRREFLERYRIGGAGPEELESCYGA